MILEYFWARVKPEPETGCWKWTGSKTRGYGVFTFCRIPNYAHRFSYEIHKGPLNGLDVCHKCDVPDCVNPDHLFAGTQSDNCTDMWRKGRARQPLGERNSHSKLKREQVWEIRRREDKTQRELAAEYGVTLTMVSLIRRRKAWRWLPEEANQQGERVAA